jgi:hypothetical protein
VAVAQTRALLAGSSFAISPADGGGRRGFRLPRAPCNCATAPPVSRTKYGGTGPDNQPVTIDAAASLLERDFPYGCVRQLLEPSLTANADGESLFAGAAALSRPLFSVTGDGASDGFALLHALYWLINNLAAKRPLALLDEATQLQAASATA